MIDLLKVVGVDVEKDSLATVIDKIGKSGMRSVKYALEEDGAATGLFLLCADPVAAKRINEVVGRIEEKIEQEEYEEEDATVA
ncbi:hypothetical protein HMPREF0326_02623 [Desulfovibrio sp. 3_1_syn3]|mgnify:CR=1 FL=1|uniref:hypothetical protein n=1 Tax=Desulfovibrio sp. 3_1_syn3 TaxID=457398 RepID=UPI0001E12F7E|nr:hypothetical protein [Desulfovibrio sp. 3_1_syn3]EFL84761.1 hypothetical protein HMPREF0326_02623 [Desulfovibrio sp. 3_1_syn3]